MAKGIIDKPFGSRTAVYRCQVDLFALLAQELIDACNRRRTISLSEWFDLPEYHRFIVGAYGAGFVCFDLAPMKTFQESFLRPRVYFANLGLRELRHWTHTLLRAERWADGYDSPIRNSIESGSLQFVIERLVSDETLRASYLAEIISTE